MEEDESIGARDGREVGTSTAKPKSMVEQHRAKLQQAKQEIAMSKMKVLLPDVREGLLREALGVSDWNVEMSLDLLEGFMKTQGRELALIDDKIRSRQTYLLEKSGIRLEEKEKRESRRKDGEHTSRKSHRRRKKSRHRSRSKSPREKRRSRYGKYGIIREADMSEKRPEFTLWAIEQKRLDFETMSRSREKELFSEFMEEYNTATFPHRKYYDLKKYEIEKSRRHGHRDTTKEWMMFDDEADRQREREQQKEMEQSQRFREIYEELQRGDKAKSMREQDLLRQKRDLAYRTGDIEEAERITQRLRPDPQ